MSSPPTAGTLLCPTAPARPTRLLRLQANQAIRLDDPARVLLVRQGGLHVLSCRFRQGSPLGERRHLFELAAGQAAFGCAAGEEDGLSLLALALAQTELEEHSLDDLAKLLAGDAAARALVDGWVARVGPLLSGGSPASAALLQPEEPGELELLGKEQLAPAPAPHRTCWLRVRSGSLALHGDAALLLTAQHGFCLLAASCWVQALTEVVQLGSWWSEHPPGAAPPLAEALGNLHRLLLADQWRQREFERRQRAERRVASARHEQAEARRAMRELASLLDPQPRFEVQQSPLLTALTVVGQAQGITIEPPGRWEEPSRQSDPLAATARASRIRYRRVLLEPGWQDSDSGPLLAFLADDGEVGGRPVALLRGSRGCQLVDPADLQPRPLSAALAARLRPDAYMLYRPLPEELHGLGGMLRHLLRHRLGDLLFALGLVTLATLLALVVPRATATLIDAAIPQADRPLLWQLALILAGATLGQVLFTWVQAMTAIRMSTATQLLAQTGMWDRLLKLRPSFFRRYSAGDLGSRVGALGEVARQLDAAALRPLLSGSLSCLNLLLLLYYSPTLAAFAVLVGLLVLAVTLSSAVVIRKRSLRYQELAG
ncbi:MAG: hypothetical protein FJ125_11410, partial [Deltaproteobacteria bacterium]|nr:hypothetical protein [Deltaproteobacteria bacterium]